MTIKTIRLDNPQEALELLGEQDAALRQMERDFGVQMFLRQDLESSELALEVAGGAARVEKALRRLRDQLSLLRQRRERAGERDARAPAGLVPQSMNLPLEEGVYRPASGKDPAAHAKPGQIRERHHEVRPSIRCRTGRHRQNLPRCIRAARWSQGRCIASS